MLSRPLRLSTIYSAKAEKSICTKLSLHFILIIN